MLQKCNAESRAETGFDNLVLAGQAASAATVAGSIDTDAHLRATLNVYGNAIASAIGPPSTNARRHNDALIAAGTGTSLPVNVPYNEAKVFSLRVVLRVPEMITSARDTVAFYQYSRQHAHLLGMQKRKCSEHSSPDSGSHVLRSLPDGRL
eukprot:g80542.t1